MVIDRPHFYFTADKIKRFISYAILFLFLVAIIASIIFSLDNSTAFDVGVYSFILIFILIIVYLILWFIT